MLSLDLRSCRAVLGPLVLAVATGTASAQDLEPRRWSHQPVGTAVGGLVYAFTDGDLQFDPVLEIQGATLTSHSAVASYSRWFGLFGETARFDAFLPYSRSRWSGTLSGAPASATREGFGDPWVRLSWNWLGSPAMDAQSFRDHYAGRSSHTVGGVGLEVKLPLGKYYEDRLLNIGQNRFVVRPQAGVVHTRGSWSYELTGSLYWFDDNDEFFGGNVLEQDSIWALQGHVVHSFPSRAWVSLSAGYSWGGETRVNEVPKDDDRSYVLSALSLGVPVAERQALKLVYTRGDTKRLVGLDANTLVLSWTMRI